MTFFIDTSDNDEALLALLGEKSLVHKFSSVDLSEKLAVEIKKFFKKNKVNLKQVKKIAVVTGPGGFSKIRSGVAAANALAFALNIPVFPLNKTQAEDLSNLKLNRPQKMVRPAYGREPNITLAKK